MGTVSENRAYYADYDWRFGGDEWSTPWGDTCSMWRHSLAPRLDQYLPASTVVEIGAGHGRIARHLLSHCRQRLHLIDIMPRCIDTCARLFADDPRVVATLGDGRTLPGVASNSVDLIVCFYSLVHADADTISAYAREFARVLRPNGVAFLHHSNAGIYFAPDKAGTDRRMGLLSIYRDVTMSAARMRRIASDFDLCCIHQECINWDVKEALTDCFSTIARTGSTWAKEPNEILNLGFRNEMNAAARRRSGANRHCGLSRR